MLTRDRAGVDGNRNVGVERVGLTALDGGMLTRDEGVVIEIEGTVLARLGKDWVDLNAGDCVVVTVRLGCRGVTCGGCQEGGV